MPDDRITADPHRPERTPPPPPQQGGVVGLVREGLSKIGLQGERLVLVIVLFVFLFFIWLYLSQDRTEVKSKIESVQKTLDTINEQMRDALKTQARMEGQQRINEHFLRGIVEELKRVGGKKPAGADEFGFNFEAFLRTAEGAMFPPDPLPLVFDP